jgi:alkylhydroperoxidase family enzyme
MPRIPPDDSVQMPGLEVASFATMEKLLRVMAHRPALMQQTMQMIETAMRQGTVEPKLKELLAIRVSQVNHCFY